MQDIAGRAEAVALLRWYDEMGVDIAIDETPVDRLAAPAPKPATEARAPDQAFVQRPAGFGLLQEGVAPSTFAAVPFLVFAAPFIIMRNTLRGARIERRRVEFVMMATVLAGFWSLMSGTFFLMTLRAAGLLA